MYCTEDWVVHVCSVIFVLFFHHKLLIPIPQLRAVLGLSLVKGRLTRNWVTVNMINTFFLTCTHSSLDWESWVRKIICSLSLKLIWVRIHLMPTTSSCEWSMGQVLEYTWYLLYLIEPLQQHTERFYYSSCFMSEGMRPREIQSPAQWKPHCWLQSFGHHCQPIE